jgi:hypothetical protein
VYIFVKQEAPSYIIHNLDYRDSLKGVKESIMRATAWKPLNCLRNKDQQDALFLLRLFQ